MNLNNLLLLSLLFVASFRLMAESEVIQQYNRTEVTQQLNKSFKRLSYSAFLAQGLITDYDQKIRNTQKKINDLQLEGLKSAFWYPHLTLELQTSSQRIGRLKSGDSTQFSKVPSGSFALNFGEYTIFNWGKDYLQFQNNLSTLKRSQENISEKRRELKHQIIKNFFTLVTLKKQEESARNILRQISFIYRYTKEKVNQKKIQISNFYAARDSYLKAQADFYETKRELQTAMEEIAYALNDPIGTQYVIDEELNFQKLTLSINEALKLARSYSPYTKQSIYELTNAKRDYEIAVKENLPLPKITLNLGAYQHAFGNGINETGYVNGVDDSVELVASINAKWDITGDNGFLNHNKTATKLLQFNQAQINHTRYKHFIESQIRTYYDQIKNSERLYLIYKVKKENLDKTVDYMIDRYMSGKISFLYLKTYLEELRETEKNFYNTQLTHLRYKLALADLIGVDDFPGNNFAKLATKVIK